MHIRNVTFQTSALHAMKQFYSCVLSLPLIEESENSFTIAVGETAVSFTKAEGEDEPFYHFAINIPENKIEEAIKWLEKKVELSSDEGQVKIHFESWNAHSVYFIDPSGNIVELIARHSLDNGVNEPFSSDHFLCISEIGLPVDNVLEVVKDVRDLGLTTWRAPSESFSTIGDENGLFIIVSKGRVWYMSNKEAEAFPVKIVIKDDKDFTFTLDQYEFIAEVLE